MPTTFEQDLETALTGIRLHSDTVPPKATYPCAAYQIISSRQFRTHAGNSLRRPRVQITAWGTSRPSVITTANTIKELLDLNQTDFELATIEDEGQGKEVDSELTLYFIRLDFYIWTSK